MIPKRDSELTTEAEIRERMVSINRQRDRLCSQGYRTNHVDELRKRQAKIAKLTEREDALRPRLRDAIKQEHEALIDRTAL